MISFFAVPLLGAMLAAQTGAKEQPAGQRLSSQQQNASLPARPVTLDEVLALAEKQNPALRAAHASIEGADAAIVTAKAYLNPTITFGTLGRQQALLQAAAYPGMLHGFNVSQPFELPSVRSTRLRAAEVRRQSSTFALAETRLAVRGAVKQAFYEALRRKREIELAQGNVELLEDLRRRIAVQVNVGEAARLELTRAEAEVASATIAVRSAQLRFSAAMSALYAATGAQLGRVEPAGDLARPQILPPLRELQQEVATRHPTLALAESRIRFAEATVDSQKAQRMPQPSFWMDWFQQPEAAQYRFGISPLFARV